MARPFVKFAIVGALGFVLQLGTLWLLTAFARWSWLAATIAAVECAIVHNFVWHERWTWADRGGRQSWRGRVARFGRFNAATATTSVAGNVLVMAILAGWLRMPAVPANVIAVGVLSLVNFLLADRWVFTPTAAWRAPGIAIVTLLAVATVASAAPTPETLDAWNKYLATAEKRIDEQRSCPTTPAGVTAAGETIDVGSGTISHWRGAVLLRGLTVDQLLQRLQHPGTPPPQEDVVSSRVLERAPDFLRVYMRLVRHAIVTVSYDTEHEMRFTRRRPGLATARSVATRISEVGGGDHGFLWRLNSYWRYEQVAEGVLVSVESLTLSRDVPTLIKPIAGRIVPRIARESMIRTLEALDLYTRRP
jgi:putative flippase GtrA